MQRFISILVLAFMAPSLVAQEVLVHPYVQPGDGSKLGKSDVKVVAWVTDQKEGRFTVEYGEDYGKKANPRRVELNLTEKQKYFTYSAILKDLPFNARVAYRVKRGDKVISQGEFATRHTRDQASRFLVLGDMGSGKSEQVRVAYQMSVVNPEFMVVCGDIVYSKGRVSEYFSNFWNQYNNTPKADPTLGAPLLRSTILYPVLGNHDINGANLAEFPDGLAAFYFYHPPLNGPKNSPWATPVSGPAEQVAAFKKAAGDNYPGLCNYSFDNGPAHFVCLDANRYAWIADESITKWLEEDLAATDAKWKFVFFHQPGFNSSDKHYTEQRMRLLAPVFEKAGVDVVFSGHVHNYQRSKPLKFKPDVTDRLSIRGDVSGKFTLDEKFDGQTNTKPDGVIYIVTGAGGAGLYDPTFTDDPEKWKRPSNWAPFTSKFISDRHSFSVVEVTPDEFKLQQIDVEGKEVDSIRITRK